MALRDTAAYQAWKTTRAFRRWRRRGYAEPVPDIVKQGVFRRHNIPGATWVETGTFKGDTTAYLAGFSPRVISLEPAEALFSAARARFAGRPEIELINAPSEDAFPALVESLTGDVCFWLDGHYSAGSTFKGETDTPLNVEMAAIEAALPHLGRLSVLIDDIRCCDPAFQAHDGYPTLDEIVDWARRCGMTWKIEYDIFIARR